MERLNNLFKQQPDDVVQWVDTSDKDGVFLFTFDGKKAFNLFADYPHKLTAEQKKIFDKENPFWADFFAER